MNENHSFNVLLAKAAGSIEKAILLGRVWLFVDHNRLTEKHFYDNKFWMYDSSTKLSEVYPYMESRSIRRWFKSLEEEGWLISGNFNQRKNDLTKWYALGPKFVEWLTKNNDESEKEKSTKTDEKPHGQNDREDNLPGQNGQSIGQNIRTHGQNVRTLPMYPNISQCSSRKEPATPTFPSEEPLRKERENIDTTIERYYRHWFGKPDVHPIADVNAVCKLFNSHVLSVGYDEMLKIISRAFERVCQEKTKNHWVTKEVLLRIGWGVTDFLKDRAKKEAEAKKAEDKRKLDEEIKAGEGIKLNLIKNFEMFGKMEKDKIADKKPIDAENKKRRKRIEDEMEREIEDA